MAMYRQAFTLVEVLLVILLLGLLAVFVFPNFDLEIRRRSLVESADRLRSLIVMTHAKAMQDGIGYRIQFPGTADPNDPNADPEIDVPKLTLQPNVLRQTDSLERPDLYGPFAADWKSQKVMQDGTRCVAVFSGRPNFEITPHSPIAGPSITEGQAIFNPLTLQPDGTCNWITFVLTDLPFDIEIEPHHVGRILNVIVDGRTGQTWIQRALRVEEVELMQEKGASPILHIDFTRPNMITEENILEVNIRSGGGVSSGRRRR